MKDNWRVSVGFKQRYLKELEKLNLPPGWSKPVKKRIYLIRYSPRKLDPTNLTIKPIEDALVQKGILVDDTDEWVEHGEFKQIISSEKKTIIIVEEI